MNTYGRSCWEKIGRTEEEAKAFIAKVKGKKWDRIKDGELSYYLCDYCGKYHVGHKRSAIME